MKNPTFPLLRSAQRGFTLVELMVSLTIGMVIVLFVTAMYVSSHGSYRIIDDNMRMQQDGRSVMHLIGRNLMQAEFGHLIALEANAQPTDFSGQGLHGCDTGFANPGVFAAATPAACAAAGSPAFEISYRVEDTVTTNIGAGTDCNGQTVPLNAAGHAVNRFYLATKSGETIQSLYCSGNGGAPQPLLGNVEVMRLTYGVDTDGNRSPDRFVNSAATVDGLSADWRGVISVGVCLEVSSPNNVTPSFQTYIDCSGASKTATDRRLRTVLNSTFTLRNNAAASNL